MAREIERKFLVRDERWREAAHAHYHMKQGYLTNQKNVSIRVRIDHQGRAHLNIKSYTLGISRDEYEYDIPRADAEEILDNLAMKPLIDKTRHLVRFGDHLWEVDEFRGDNAGLVVAEIELGAEDEPFELPPWVGAEVSDDPRYLNSCLIQHPYCDWPEVARARRHGE